MIENSRIVDYESLVQELERVRYRERYMETIRPTIFIMSVITACALLIATLLLPGVQVHNQSMPLSDAEDRMVSYGKCNLAGTYTVPGGQYFVLGDNREDTPDTPDSRRVHDALINRR